MKLFSIGCLLGMVLGVSLAVWVFRIEVDVLGVPYVGKTYLTTEQIELTSGDTAFTLPPGVRLIHRYTAKDQERWELAIMTLPLESLPVAKSVLEGDPVAWPSEE